LITIDRITSILQSLIFAYALVYCVDKKLENNKLKLFFMVLMFTIIGTAFSGAFFDNPAIIVFLTHMLALGLVILMYRRNVRNALMAYTIVYNIIIIYSILFGNVIFASAIELLPSQYINQASIFIIYIPQWVLIFLCLKYFKKINRVYRVLINEGLLIYSLIISFAMDFIVTFYLLTFGAKSQLMKNIIYMMFFVFFVVVLLYFRKIHNKSEQISKLNETLESKNNELRKIKHDYGAQISYLYGLCLMDRHLDLKKSLKDIINVNEAIATAVEVSPNENSLLSLALKPAIEEGIHVIVEEKGDLSLAAISEMELYRIISNIVNNAITAMNGQGIIIAKSYEYLEKLIIKIENNGPMIEENILKDIFRQGYTSKNNTDGNHGYGLNIVQELVKKHSGKVEVKSSDISTEFKIILPIKQIT